MASTFTPNVQLEEPARGDKVGVWDSPVNANMTLLDLLAGATTTISLNNSNVVLSAAQFQSAYISFNSTLTGSVTITFPTSFTKGYTVSHLCTGSSAFTITLQTTAAGGQVVCARPGNPFQCWNDGTNIKFVNLGTEVGGYWHYAGSSNPAWNTGCTVPPYLYANGSSFSGTTYPQLAVIIPGLVLPDSRGRAQANFNDGTGRMNSSNSGVDGNTLFATGGSEFAQAHEHAFTGTQQTWNTNQTTVWVGPGQVGVNGTGASPTVVSVSQGTAQQTLTTTVTPAGTIGSSITVNSSISGVTGQSTVSQNMQPTYVGGMTFIRAA